MNAAMIILIVVLAVVVSGALCGFLFFRMGIKYRKQIAEAEIGSAEEQAKRILENANKEASAKHNQALIEAKDDAYKLRNEVEREIKEQPRSASRLRATTTWLTLRARSTCPSSTHTDSTISIKAPASKAHKGMKT